MQTQYTRRQAPRFTRAHLILLVAALSSPLATVAQDKIITWGWANSSEWNSKLHVTALRTGCSSAPESCLRDADRAASQNHIQTIFLPIVLKPQQTLIYVTQYAALSASHPEVVEVGFDDFVSQASKLGMDPASRNTYLLQIIRALKTNSQLKFGCTIYEDELASKLSQLGLSNEFYSEVDFVHLYPHYRRTSESFANYVKQAKSLFPKAEIIAGVYAYDRRDYIPCSQGSSQHCSNQDELSLFKDMFQQQVSLLRSGQVSALEFYPGAFGMEETWKNWSEPRICDASRRQECIDNTKSMRQAVLQILGSR